MPTATEGRPANRAAAAASSGAPGTDAAAAAAANAAADPWRGANPLDPHFRVDPYPFLKALRENDPVNQTPLGFWRLTRYADVERLLKEVPTGVRHADGTRAGESSATAQRPGEFMLLQDPPNHTRLRRLVSQAFTLRAIEKMRPHVQELVDRLLDAVADKGTLDVIADLALPLPSTVICEMMGVPLADRERFTDWTADATHLLATVVAAPEAIERGLAASDALQAYFTQLIAERRSNLGDDLLSGLIRAEEAGDRLSQTELISQSIGLLIAGFETTIGLIGNGVLALLRHPEQVALLRAEPARITNAVDECLRYDGPISLTVRILREDTRFGDTVIPADAMIWAILAAAHRDPEHYEDPDRFDITRENVQGLAFGGGAHYCLGAHLARMEAQVAIGSLVQRMSGLEVDSPSGELDWGRSLFRVLARLPVRFASARAAS